MKTAVIMLCCWCSGICFFLQNNLASAELLDKIVAVFDEELILLSEVREAGENQVVQAVVNLDASVTVEQDVLRYMIERRLLRREIQYLAFPKEKELAKTLATQYIINTYHDNDAESFAAKVENHGVTDTDLEEELTLYMKGVDYIRRKYRFNADIDNPEVVLNLLQKWIKDLNAQANIQTLL